MGSPALVCKCSGRLLRGYAVRFVVMVRLSLRLLGFFLKFAGISTTTSPSWFDIYTYTCILFSCLPCFFVKNGLHLPTKAETDIMDHIIRSFFKDKLTATYCKHNDANYPMMEYVFKSISWSSFLLESTNCVFPSQKKTSTVFCINKTQAEKKKKKTETQKSATIISSIPTSSSHHPSPPGCYHHHPPPGSAIGSTSSALVFRCPLSAISVQVSGLQLSGPFPFFLRWKWHGALWFGLRVWAWFIFGFIMV